jgi:Mo-dependent nitrogenase C-terminus
MIMMPTLTQKTQSQSLSVLQSLRQWIEATEIDEERLARRIVKLIPATCPFAREVRLFGRVIFRIPALCKLNPLYEQLMTLRFRAMSFLADQCGEDITSYCT